MSKGCFIITNEKKYKILDFLSPLSCTMREYIEKNKNSTYTLYYKVITHSDVPYGKNKEKKAIKKRERMKQLDKNILYYNTSKQMYNLEKKTLKEYPSAHQSSITFSNKLYRQLGIDIIQRRDGRQLTNHHHENLADYANVQIVCDTLKYFSNEYTEKIVEKLNRIIPWRKSEYVLKYDKSQKFIKTDLHYTVHGLCNKEDKLLKVIRHNLFVGDMIAVLVEEKTNEKNIFLLFGKNKRFFELLNIKNEGWFNYIESDDQRKENYGRVGQGAWRNELAAEIITYNLNSNKVFCPITDISCEYEELGTLFRASHILPFSECNEEQKYDLNNGLFLSVTADALFDKYFISIDKNKKIKYSKFISKDLKQKLRLERYNQEILNNLLNENRMKYLEEHYKRFVQKEEQRKEKEKEKYVKSREYDSN